MIKSMTGFGRGEYTDGLYNFKVEIKAVNHRYNDISIRMPNHINYLEEKIKRVIKKEIHRGKIDVYVNLEYVEESSIDVKVDIDLAKSYKEALKLLCKELNLEKDIRINNILSMPDIIKTQRKVLDEDEIWICLKESLKISLKDIMTMKTLEGEELKKDMMFHLDKIAEFLIQIEERSPLVVIEYKEKLKERISNLLDNNLDIDEDKINSEIVYFADKSNINEEIIRLESHLKQFESILKESSPVGRKLDFLIQELNREINTIGAKASDMIISQNVVEVKSEIEQIREQVQNVE
ncbi:MAG TPA: YicC/YloC family endoribonuclease [Tissierellaceae bacterium]|nr:YicC/YloC family endoribonuclease [Tissierellaceae bacterium]